MAGKDSRQHARYKSTGTVFIDFILNLVWHEGGFGSWVKLCCVFEVFFNLTYKRKSSTILTLQLRFQFFLCNWAEKRMEMFHKQHLEITFLGRTGIFVRWSGRWCAPVGGVAACNQSDFFLGTNHWFFDFFSPQLAKLMKLCSLTSADLDWNTSKEGHLYPHPQICIVCGGTFGVYLRWSWDELARWFQRFLQPRASFTMCYQSVPLLPGSG